MGMFALLRGPKGDDGAAGAKGDTGDTGAAGAKGDKGDTGEAGAAALTSYGDPSSYDFVRTDLTLDNTWNDLDFSGKVPEGTTWVLVNIKFKSTVVGRYVAFRKKGNSNGINVATIMNCVNDVSQSHFCLLELDGDRVCQYAGPADAWIDINIAIRATMP